MNKYEWDICISGTRMHPIEVYRGSFVIDRNGEKYFRSLGADQAFYTGPWGIFGSTMNSTEEWPLPTELSVIWFSYTEMKFYGGNFTLPYSEIKELFDNGVLKRSVKDGVQIRKYDNFLIGLAPGGMVVVWACGAFYLKEITRFQAEEVKLTLKEFRPTRANETLEGFTQSRMTNAPYAVEYCAEHGVEKELFERYMERFKTGFIINLEDKTYNKLNCFDVQFANGERLPFFPEDKEFSERGDYGSVKYIGMEWIHTSYGEKKEMQAYVCIKKEEFLRIYNEAWGTDHNKPIDVVVNIGKLNNSIEIYLTDGVNRYDYNMEYVQAEIWETESGKVLYRSPNYVYGKDGDTVWDNNSD